MTDYAYVAFLDILGYKDLLDLDISNGTQNFKNCMTTAYRVFEPVNNSKYHYKAISDSIFITCGDREAVVEFIDIVRRVYTSFIEEGLLIRGGISYGEHFENNSVTYSPALTKAYTLESNVAEFPRIMVDNNIADMFGILSRDLKILKTGNYFFLNIATKDTYKNIWDSLKSTYEKNIDTIKKSEKVRIKYRWLHDFLIEVAPRMDVPGYDRYIYTFDN